MLALKRSSISPLNITLSSRSQRLVRNVATQAARKEGDISSVFVSLSGQKPEPLPERFADIKRQLIQGSEDAVAASWKRLLSQLKDENDLVKQHGSKIIPQIDFSTKDSLRSESIEEIKKRGVVVIKGVVPEAEARAYKTEVEEYVKLNPSTKAFPADKPAVFELYWSQPQVKARAHPNMLDAQKWLMNLWHSKDDKALISTSQPLSYADRVRIRQPGDGQFALGPHVDGGSVERWEPNGYGLGSVYDKIWAGKWEEYDPWESSCRIPVNSDLYQGSGSCSMFRMFQGWLSMSHTGPHEGTLSVNPLLQLATAYFLLRPFFEPINPLDPKRGGSVEFLRPSNWRFKSGKEMTTELHGANPGNGQELNDVFHPHLNLKDTMVSIPQISPGDFVAWHCDTIHAVDSLHAGKSDSSVLYIPACPTTVSNLNYLVSQRGTFLSGHPGPDFPGGKGESEHVERADLRFLAGLGDDALRAMGFLKLRAKENLTKEGRPEERVWRPSSELDREGNAILGFD